jgi:hypothetical protein
MASLFAGGAMRKILENLEVVPYRGTLQAPSGTTVAPSRTSEQEIMGLCLFDPSMRNFLFEIADRYRGVVQIRLTVVSKHTKHAQPNNPTVVINGRTMRHKEMGTWVYAAGEAPFGMEAWVYVDAPFTVQLTAPGFLPAVLTVPLTAKKPSAKLAMVPEPSEDAEAATAKVTAEKGRTTGRRSSKGAGGTSTQRDGTATGVWLGDCLIV